MPWVRALSSLRWFGVALSGEFDLWLSQGGIVPSYALIVREYMPAEEAGARVGFVLMMTIWGMALGGWMSGWIYDVSSSYQMAFLNGIVWNLVNIGLVLALFFRKPAPLLPIAAR